MRAFATLAGMLLGLAAVAAGAALAQHPAFTRSNEAFRAGDYAAAAADLETLLAETPEWPAGWIRLGQCRYLLGDPAAGDTAIERAREIDPTTDVHDAYRVVGMLLYRAKRFGEAAVALNRARASVAEGDDPRRDAVREALGYAQFQAKRYADARRTLEAHQREAGFAVEPAWYLALSCQELDDYPCALEQLESVAADGGRRRARAIEYLAKWSNYHAEHGAGNREFLRAAAVRHAGAWYREAPDLAEAVELYASTMLAAGRAAQLVEELGKHAADDNCQVPLQLARAYNVLDRREAAETRGLEALACDPTSGDANVEIAYSRAARLRSEHTQLVAVLEDQALARSALELIEEARRLDPSRPQRGQELERQLRETLARLEEAAQAFASEEADFQRQLANEEREGIRKRCLNLLWIRRDESRSLSDDEQRFFDVHDCRQYAR